MPCSSIIVYEHLFSLPKNGFQKNTVKLQNFSIASLVEPNRIKHAWVRSNPNFLNILMFFRVRFDWTVISFERKNRTKLEKTFQFSFTVNRFENETINKIKSVRNWNRNPRTGLLYLIFMKQLGIVSKIIRQLKIFTPSQIKAR